MAYVIVNDLEQSFWWDTVEFLFTADSYLIYAAFSRC